MHVGVGAAVVEEDKSGGKNRKNKVGPPEAYQSARNCFIITEMRRHNLLLKIIQTFFSSTKTRVCVWGGSVPHFL